MPATCLQHACNMPAHVCACLHMSAHISPHPCLHVYTMSIQISIRVSVYRSRHTYIFIRTCAHRHVVPRWSHGFVRCWRLVTTSSMPGPSAHQADRITPRRQTGLAYRHACRRARVLTRACLHAHMHACTGVQAAASELRGLLGQLDALVGSRYRRVCERACVCV